MSQIAFDPIGYSDALQKAGMPKEQADLIARTQEASFDKLIEARDLATRRDLELGLLNLRSDMQRMFMRQQADLVRWMIGLIAGPGAYLVAMMALLK